MRMEVADSSSGLVGEARADEILSHYSRLALARERRGDFEGAAEILTHFENTGYHDWVDPEAPRLGSIRQRIARLSQADGRKGQSATPLAMIDPKRTYGKVDEDAACEVASALRNVLPGWLTAAPTPGQPVLREIRFRFASERGEPLSQIEGALRELIGAGEESDLAWRVERVQAYRGSRIEDWILIDQGKEKDTSGAFRIIAAAKTLGGEFELQTLVLCFLDRGEFSSSEQIMNLLNRRPEEWEGWRSLASRTLDLLKRACRRVSQQQLRREEDDGGSHGRLREL